MDIIDQAQDYQTRAIKHSLAAHAARIPAGESARECSDCGDPIPEQRREAAPGCTRCVSCQQEADSTLPT